MKILVPELGFSAGSETVVLQVLPRWVKAGHEVLLAAPPHRLRRYRERGLDERVRCVPLGWSGSGWRRWVRTLGDRTSSGVLQMAGLRDQAKREGATHVFLPWIVQQPLVDFGRPCGVMLMDLAWRHYPENWFGWSADRLDQALERWLAKATVVYPVSESTEREAATAFPQMRGKLATVPHGSAWRGIGRRSSGNASVYFLTPAGMTPNKNHYALLCAAIQVWREGVDFRLVWTGSGSDRVIAAGDARSDEVRRLQHLYRDHQELVAGRLEGLGFVSEARLDDLFAGARRVVLPSTYEGFGLPVMEAFERGARVICTDIAPFEEQVRRHGMEARATRVAVGDVTALAEALRSACRDDVTEDVVDEAELRRGVEAWTWDDAARAYARALEAGTKVTAAPARTPPR